MVLIAELGWFSSTNRRYSFILALFPPIFGEMGIWITPVFAEGATLLVGMSLLYQWMYQEKIAEVKGVISQETTG